MSANRKGGSRGRNAGATQTPAALALPSDPGSDFDLLRARGLVLPVDGMDLALLRDGFSEARGARRHEALDILAPRGTRVRAVDDGVVRKLYTSAGGGLTIYQFDPTETFCYYYAHLDAYAPFLTDNTAVAKGDVIGYVGTTGNAPRDTPHLHFTIYRLTPSRRWWEGTALNPFPLWVSAGATDAE